MGRCSTEVTLKVEGCLPALITGQLHTSHCNVPSVLLHAEALA